MRRLVVNALALAVVLAGMGLGLGQPPGQPAKKPVRVEEEDVPKAKPAPVKSKLEEMLAEALKNNPDIRVAAANVTLAEAELNRTRLQVTQKVIALHAALASQQAEVAYRQSQYERIKKLEESKSVSSEIVQEAQQKLAAAKAKLAEVESQMPSLLGKVERLGKINASSDLLKITIGSDLGFPIAEDRLKIHRSDSQRTTGPVAEKIRQAMEKPITLKVSNEFIQDVLLHLQKHSGINIKLATDGLPEPKVNLEFNDLSFRAALQYLEDSEPGYRFVIREYGILFAPEGKLPPGALTVQEFLRQKPGDAPRDRETESRNPPPENVQGVIKQVDSSGLMTISIGSDAGLSKGHTLEVFRFTGSGPSQSKYLGTIRILEVKAKEAVAKPVGRMASPPYVNDQVASRLIGK
jgi:hypothetical protein